MNFLQRCAAAAVACLLATSAIAQPITVADVKYEESNSVSGSSLQLNGAGVRYKAVFKVYTAGLYLEKKAATPAEIMALKGPKRMSITMLREIGSPANIPDFISKVKDKDSHVRLMGFGHRVYKNYDPRAAVLRESAHEVLAELGRADDPLLPIAEELEKIALNDDYFVERKLFPNVDFYSGIILQAMGIPTSMFTAIFALARTVGWVAQWNEMMEDPEQKIGRPRQLYTGPTQRPFVPIEQRG